MATLMKCVASKLFGIACLVRIFGKYLFFGRSCNTCVVLPYMKNDNPQTNQTNKLLALMPFKFKYTYSHIALRL